MTSRLCCYLLILLMCSFLLPAQTTSDWNDDQVELPSIAGSPYHKDIVVAVIDTGIDFSHPDFADRIWNNTDEIKDNGIDDDQNGYIDDSKGWDFSDNDAIPQDENSHGTHVTGILASPEVGLAPQTTIMVLRAFDSEGNADYADVADAIRYATDNGADIISMSLGGSTGSTSLATAIQYAHSHGVLLVAAAGNNGRGVIDYPARYDQVIAVGSVDSLGNRSTFSNYGSSLELMAPGEVINSTVSVSTGLSARIAELPNSTAYAMQYSNITSGEETHPLIYGGAGSVSDLAGTNATGKIVLIERNTLTFSTMALNVRDAGGVGMVVFNSEDGIFAGTLQSEVGIYAMSITRSMGLVLNQSLSSTSTLTFEISPSDYFVMSGTSMSVPHISAIASIMMGTYDLNSTQTRHYLRIGADNVTNTYRSSSYGFGRVNATRIVKVLGDTIQPTAAYEILTYEENSLGKIDFEVSVLIEDTIGLDNIIYRYHKNSIPIEHQSDLYEQRIVTQIIPGEILSNESRSVISVIIEDLNYNYASLNITIQRQASGITIPDSRTSTDDFLGYPLFGLLVIFTIRRRKNQ